MIIKQLQTLLKTLPKSHLHFSTIPPQPSPNPPPSPASPPSRPSPTIIPIQTLSQLLKHRKQNQVPNLNLPQYTPTSLQITLLKALKRHLYQIPEEEEKIIGIVRKYKDDMEYVGRLVGLLLPVDEMFCALNLEYKQIVIKYLIHTPSPHKQSLLTILQNLHRLTTPKQSQYLDENWLTRDYSQQQQIAKLLTTKLLQMKHQFDFDVYVQVSRLCDTLAVDCWELGGYLLGGIEGREGMEGREGREGREGSWRMRIGEVFGVLGYLGRMGIFPYQYFYRNKSRWISTIQSYNKYSTKKTYESIKMLQILINQNPQFCQKLTKKLQQILLQAMPSLDHEQLANLWLIINRAKFSICPQLLGKMLQKMGELVDSMEEKELCLVVRGFDRFRFDWADWNRKEKGTERDGRDGRDGTGRNLEVCEGVLRVVWRRLNERRVYQREIVKEILKKFQNNRNQVKQQKPAYQLLAS